MTHGSVAATLATLTQPIGIRSLPTAVPANAQPERILRDAQEADIPIFFEHQRDPEATSMAAFPTRNWDAFAAHWKRILASDAVTKKTILWNGEVAGNILSFDQEGKRLVGYWIGREFWGRGLATRALSELLGEVAVRPLYAYVARTNVASIRVLEKCGFVISDARTHFDERLGREIEEVLMELPSPASV